MRAAVAHACHEPLRIEELALRAPEADEVHVQVLATAICQSDLSFLDGHWGIDLPVVMGHETVGRVLAVGDLVTNTQPGDLVVVSLVRSCGNCAACNRGESVRCEGVEPRSSPLAATGGPPVTQGLDVGGFATETIVHASQVVPIPDTVPIDAAALLGCGVVTGFGAVTNRAEVSPGSRVAVIGCGGVGLNSVQAARVAGAGSIVAVDLEPAKREAALALGATSALDPAAGDLGAALRAAAGGQLADVVLVTVGSKPATEGAFGLLAPGGTLVLVGMTSTGTTIEFDATTVAALNQRVLGSKMGSVTLATDIPRLIGHYEAGDLQLDQLVSQRFPLEQINDAIAAARQADSLRIVVTMTEAPASTGAP